jgi:hypothetical protein
MALVTMSKETQRFWQLCMDPGKLPILPGSSQSSIIFTPRAKHDKAVVNCEYSMASFSTGEHKKKTKGNRRQTELSLVIQQVFEAVILTELAPRSQIDIYLQVLQADGGMAETFQVLICQERGVLVSMLLV